MVHTLPIGFIGTKRLLVKSRGKERERLLVIYFTFTKFLMVFAGFAYPFPHLILKQFSRCCSHSKESCERADFWKENALLCFTLCVSIETYVYMEPSTQNSWSKTESEICMCMCVHSHDNTKNVFESKKVSPERLQL